MKISEMIKVLGQFNQDLEVQVEIKLEGTDTVCWVPVDDVVLDYDADPPRASISVTSREGETRKDLAGMMGQVDAYIKHYDKMPRDLEKLLTAVHTVLARALTSVS